MQRSVQVSQECVTVRVRARFGDTLSNVRVTGEQSRMNLAVYRGSELYMRCCRH